MARMTQQPPSLPPNRIRPPASTLLQKLGIPFFDTFDAEHLKVAPQLSTSEAPTETELRVLRDLNERTARAHAGQA